MQYNDLMKKKGIVENDKAKIEQVIAELDEKKNEALKKAFEKVNIVSYRVFAICWLYIYMYINV